MCLVLDTFREHRKRSHFKLFFPRVRYKIFRDGMKSPLVGNYQYNIGWNVSSRPYQALNAEEETFRRIEKGFHVFTSRRHAREYLKKLAVEPHMYNTATMIIVPVTVDPKDFVACNRQQEVYMRINISTPNYWHGYYLGK